MAATTDQELDTLRTLDELCGLVERWPHGHLFVRYSRGPEHDGTEHSQDYESGLTLPGLSANPLSPEEWWTRPLSDWIARRLCNYVHLAEAEPDRVAWVLTGRVVARGPDNEPLLADHAPVAIVARSAIAEAKRVYEARFEAGRDSVS